MNISDVDKNLAVDTTVFREGLRFLDAQQPPFRTYGVYKEDGLYRRMPQEEAAKVSEKVVRMHTHTAGGRIRFITSSPYIAIKADCDITRMTHFPLTATGGFDLYGQFSEGDRYMGTFIPAYEVEHKWQSVVDLENPEERVFTIHFPLYAQVRSLQIGLQEGSVLKEAPDYKIEKPIVFYGSSITQGAAASRPGMNYENILSRRLNCNHLNLGFSGSARGEKEIAEYISKLEMSAFVLDYDHNSSVEQLGQRHEPFFRIIRKAQPDLPVVILPRPRYHLKTEDKVRRDFIYNTYLRAKNSGDQNVYFIGGEKLMELAQGEGSVDYIHPTDLGYYSMAAAIEPVLKDILYNGSKAENI